MSQSPDAGQTDRDEVADRDEIAPPLIASKPVQRTGYAVLAASGLVLATAFGGIAQLASPDAQGQPAPPIAHSAGSGSPQGGQAGPGSADDDTLTRTVDEAATSEHVSDNDDTSHSTSSEPHTVVRVGRDGETVSKVVTHGEESPSHSGRSGNVDESSSHSSDENPPSSSGGGTSDSDPTTSTGGSSSSDPGDSPSNPPSSDPGEPTSSPSEPTSSPSEPTSSSDSPSSDVPAKPNDPTQTQ